MMKKTLRIILVTTCIININVGFSQYLLNPSLEGLSDEGRCPEGWSPCNESSTPDTQPGAWNVTKPSSEGISYISLVTRGQRGLSTDNKTEGIQTKLEDKLKVDLEYDFSLDLCYFKGFDDGTSVFSTPVILKVWSAEFKDIKTELLWVSDIINHSDWINYQSVLKPTIKDANYLILEAYYTSNNKVFGNIFIDNINLSYSREELESENLFIPNVITPNFDNINDRLTIDNIPSNTRIEIFDRTGRKVYENLNYDNSWEGANSSGEELPEDTYWYVLELN